MRKDGDELIRHFARWSWDPGGEHERQAEESLRSAGLSQETRLDTGHVLIVPHPRDRRNWRLWIYHPDDPVPDPDGQRGQRLAIADLGEDPSRVGPNALKWLGHRGVMQSMRDMTQPARQDDAPWPRRFG